MKAAFTKILRKIYGVCSVLWLVWRYGLSIAKLIETKAKDHDKDPSYYEKLQAFMIFELTDKLDEIEHSLLRNNNNKKGR